MCEEEKRRSWRQQVNNLRVGASAGARTTVGPDDLLMTTRVDLSEELIYQPLYAPASAACLNYGITYKRWALATFSALNSLTQSYSYASNPAAAMANKTGHGFNEPRKTAQGGWPSSRDMTLETDTLQLLAANLETADPDVFDILQKVRFVARSSMVQTKED